MSNIIVTWSFYKLMDKKSKSQILKINISGVAYVKVDYRSNYSIV